LSPGRLSPGRTAGSGPGPQRATRAEAAVGVELGEDGGQAGAEHLAADATQCERAGSGRPGLGSGQVGDAIPPAARAFVDAARLAALAVVDEHGEISADVLAGEPGFLRAPDERTVEIGLAPPLTAPLFGSGTERIVGLLVLEPWTRRRMRINGTAVRSGRSVTVRSEQVYANCPKYIQERTVDAVVPAAAARSWSTSPSNRRRRSLTACRCAGASGPITASTRRWKASRRHRRRYHDLNEHRLGRRAAGD
jgi:predicted pyridoxine 5'-phosphate oxidase superfamily flavin-nucleotide-binding protein